MDRYLVISSDGHAGLPPERYRDYVDPQYRDEFDRQLAAAIAERAAAESAFLISEFNTKWRAENADGLDGAWDSATRNKVMDADGVTAEVLFTDGITENNSPPFGADLGMRPFDANPELQWAGARAFNRWLSEFCQEEPVRRLGMGLCPALWDVETSVKEIHWAREHGLKGMQLSHIVEGYDNYNHPKYYPMWAALEETGMVVNFHSGASQPYDQTSPGWVGIYCCEYPFWMTRPLIAMIFGGVFDRFPKLKIAFTEVGGDFWWPGIIQLMDFRAKVKKGSAKMGDHTANLKLTPSEYVRRNVWIGSSAQMDDQNYEDYHKIGMDRVMWGTDYPHPEGTWPNTHEQMHGALDGLSETDLEKVLGLNAVECFGLDIEPLNKIASRIGPLRTQFQKAA